MLGDILFNGTHALRYGIAESIILKAMSAWLARGQVDGSCYKKGEELWVQLTIAQMQADLPFLSAYRIRAALDNLIYEKLLITDEQQLKAGLRKRKLVGYSFTEKGRKLMEGYSYDNNGAG